MRSLGDRIVELRYHPHSRGNPYQDMLYGLCEASRILPRSLDDLEDVTATPSASPEADVVLHVHWTDTVLLGATDQTDAAARIARLTATLDGFIADGGRIIWTVHNVLPHEARFPELEANVCQAIASRAAAVHVMCAATTEAAAEWYEIPPDRLAVIPHASYLGVYPNHVSRSEARARLGLGPHHSVLTVFGGLRPYKAPMALLDAFEAASASDPDLRLVIAGKPIRLAALEAFRARCKRNPAIISRLRTVEGRRIQLYLNAADAVLLPHAAALNSGLVGLAYSFGRPVIAPDLGCIAPQVPAGCGLLFAADDRGSLEQAIRRAPELKDPRFGAAALERAQAYPPAAMARDFVSLVERVVGEES